MRDYLFCVIVIQSVLVRDILYELASVGDLPLPQPSPQGTKRERDSDSPPPASRPASTPKECPRTTAGTRRISREIYAHPQSQQHRQQPPPSQPPPSYNLPVYSNDLGRIPLHGQVTFQMAGSPTASTSSGSMQSPNMWFSSSNGIQQPSNPPPAPMNGHNFAHGDTYAIDNLFLDQMSSPFGAFSPQQTHHSAGHGHSHSHGHGNGNGNQSTATELQAFVDATSAAGGVQPLIMQTDPAMFDVDPDTIAMWSSAPTGFGCVVSVFVLLFLRV